MLLLEMLRKCKGFLVCGFGGVVGVCCLGFFCIFLLLVGCFGLDFCLFLRQELEYLHDRLVCTNPKPEYAQMRLCFLDENIYFVINTLA